MPVFARKDAGRPEMPDVLVLVLSGMGSVDQVSINYASDVSEARAKADMDALGKETGWTLRAVRVSRRPVGPGGARNTTSGSFVALAAVNYTEGLLPVAPFVTVLKRFSNIEINYLLPERFQFHGLEDFENEFVKLHLERRGMSYLYRIRVKNNDFSRLILPAHQPKAQPKPQGMSSGWRLVISIVLAALAALLAYWAAGRFLRRSARD